MNQAYTENMPKDQYGGVPYGGTDIPNHIIRSAIDLASLLEWSIFILFLDLEKAYDKAIRELVLGWPQDFEGDKAQYLISIGCLPEVAEGIVRYVETDGTKFEQWKIDPKVIALLNGLHTNSWFNYSD